MKTQSTETAPKLKGRPIDLTQARLQKKNMKEAAFTIGWRSYTAESTALGVPLLEEAARLNGVGNTKPGGVVPGEIENNTDDLALLPVRDASETTLEVQWVENGTKAQINMQKLFAHRPFNIPRGTRATIPVSHAQVENMGPCLILHFGQARFEEIRPRKSAAKQVAAAQQPSDNDQK